MRVVALFLVPCLMAPPAPRMAQALCASSSPAVQAPGTEGYFPSQAIVPALLRVRQALMPRTFQVSRMAAALLAGVLAMGAWNGLRGQDFQAPSISRSSRPLAFTDSFMMAEPTTGITVTVDPQGDYHIARDMGPGVTWSFDGSVGTPVHAPTWSMGSDRAGRYQEVTFQYRALNGVPRESGIRLYIGQPTVLFTTTYLAPGRNVEPFPRFNASPETSHFAFMPWDYRFGPLNSLDNGSPWLSFDRQGNAYILSAASDMMVASSRSNSVFIEAGIDPAITTLPANFTHQTALFIGKGIGINGTFDAWGRWMTDFQGKVRPGNTADIGLRKVSAWTDAGAPYYYDPNVLAILLALRDAYEQAGILLGSVQLDSWWYPKGSDADWRHNGGGGIYRLEAGQLFLNGLGAFQQDLGLPLIVHARWIDAASPYRSLYQMSGDFVIDLRYWMDRAAYLAASGVATYEQDWISLYKTLFNLRDPRLFFDLMAQAMSEYGLTMQYCMAEPRHVIQGSMYSNLTTVRTSADRFGRDRWDVGLYDSRLVTAMGIWPFTDSVSSQDTMSMLITVLSAGPVGLGDEIRSIHPGNIAMLARRDGTIVKPDVGIVPMDQTYAADAAYAANPQGHQPPMLAHAFTDHASANSAYDGERAAYVVGYSREQDAPAEIAFSLDELGINGESCVYKYNPVTNAFDLAALNLKPRVPPRRRGDPRPVREFKFRDSVDWNGSYYVVVPVGPSGIAVLGDRDKWVTRSRQRIPRLEDDGTLSMDVDFAQGEAKVILEGYSKTPLRRVSATRGSAALVSYDAGSHRFQIEVSPGEGGLATVLLNAGIVPALKAEAAILPAGRRAGGVPNLLMAGLVLTLALTTAGCAIHQPALEQAAARLHMPPADLIRPVGLQEVEQAIDGLQAVKIAMAAAAPEAREAVTAKLRELLQDAEVLQYRAMRIVTQASYVSKKDIKRLAKAIHSAALLLPERQSALGAEFSGGMTPIRLKRSA